MTDEEKRFLEGLEKDWFGIKGEPEIKRLIAMVRERDEKLANESRQMLVRDGTRMGREIHYLKAHIAKLEAAVGILDEALDMAIYDLERIRDAAWDEYQMRLGARSGSSVARQARAKAKEVMGAT